MNVFFILQIGFIIGVYLGGWYLIPLIPLMQLLAATHPKFVIFKKRKNENKEENHPGAYPIRQSRYSQRAR